MRHRRGTAVVPAAGEHQSRRQEHASARRTRRRWRRGLVISLVLLLTLVGVGRAMLPGFVRDYVNRTLDRNPLYDGRIGDVQIHLWRGAYSIEDVQISKTTGDVPVPFFASKRVSFAIQWNALVHRKVVGRVLMEEPELNFVDAPSDEEKQTGAGGPWLKTIQKLFPFRINSGMVRNGSIHFRAFQRKNPVDVYLTEVEATIDNLSNIGDETTPLAATIQATAIAMDHARLEYKMMLDPFSYRPTFHTTLRLIGLDVTRLNDLAVAYGKFDFKRGWFDLVIDMDAKNGQLTGYVKPLFRNLKVFSVTEDLKEGDVLQFFWQAVLGVATSVFKNYSRDQFGTLVPFRADLSQATNIDILATIGNILRNAFVRAYLPQLETEPPSEGLEFGPPEFTELISVGGVL
jgi:hypothetical protein